MSLHTTPSVADNYIHADKLITRGEVLTLGGLRLKWYDVARRELGVEPEIAAHARRHLELRAAGGALDLKGDLGFVILHRCGGEFYFLIVNTWANENEIWEQVFAKESAATATFTL